jgi:hypothetical protein
MYSKVDLNRPTLFRQVNQLRREHFQMQVEVRALHSMVREACLAFQPRTGTEAIGELPVVEGACAVPDFSALRERAERFLGQLEHHEEAEDLLVMESYGTDIGTGD